MFTAGGLSCRETALLPSVGWSGGVERWHEILSSMHQGSKVGIIWYIAGG